MPDRIPEMDPVVVIRPLALYDQRRKCARDPPRAEGVDVHLELHVLFVYFDQRPHDAHAGVVDQAVKPPAGPANMCYGGIDLFLDRNVEANALDILDSGKRFDVCLLSRAPA